MDELIKKETENYIRYIILLLQGGRMLLRGIAEKALQQKNMTVKQFLNTIKSSHQLQRLSDIQKQKLLQETSEDSAFVEFDISLLVFILTNFLANDIDIRALHAVNEIREYREMYYTKANKFKMDQNTFTKEWTKLVEMIYTISAGTSEYERELYSDMIQSILSEDFDIKTGVEKIKQLDDSDDVGDNIQIRLVDVHSQQKHTSVVHERMPHVEDNMSKALRKTIMQYSDITSTGSMMPGWYMYHDYLFGKDTRNCEENEACADQEKRYYSDSGINSPIILSPQISPKIRLSVGKEISLKDDLDTLKPTSSSTGFYKEQGLDPEEIDYLEEPMSLDCRIETEKKPSEIVSNWESRRRGKRQSEQERRVEKKRRDNSGSGINSPKDSPDPVRKHMLIYTRRFVNPLTKIRMDEEHNKVPTHDLDTPTPTKDSNDFHFAQAQDPEEINYLEKLVRQDCRIKTEKKPSEIVSNWESRRRGKKQKELKRKVEKKRKDYSDSDIYSPNFPPDPALTKQWLSYTDQFVNTFTKIRKDEEHNKVPTHDLDTPTPTNDSNGFHFAQAQADQEKRYYSDSGINSPDISSPQKNHRNKGIPPNVQTNGSTIFYPDQNRLNELYKELGKHSKEIIDHCDRICSLIKSKHKSIVDVWAAVKDNADNIVFVIIVNDKNVKLDDYVEYNFIQREKGAVSQEGRELINNKAHDDWWAKVSKTKRNKLESTINTYNVELMRNHKYLTMISASPVRSKGYSTQIPTIEQEACISLYVLIKGYIPIQETQFEKEYDGIPVDVREGCFSLFTGPNVRHESLKSGCQIQRKQLESGEHLGTGTLGGFIDYHGFGTCGITCAHVLLHESEIKRLAPETEDEMDLDYETTGHFVYQPNCQSQNNFVGKVVKAIYREGGGGESGVDIAVFQIEQRFPRLGEFPALRDANHLQLSYDSGKTADYSRLGSGAVCKFGAESYFTEGSFVTDMATTSVRLYDTYEAANPYKITLHNLLEVRATDDRSRFAEQGDSGALVFCKGENNGLNCVGVVEGGTSQGTCVVMPITSILKQLNLTSLKSFENNRIEFKLEERFAQLRNSISLDVETRIEQTQRSLLHATNLRISQTEQNLQGSIDRLFQAVQSVSDNLVRYENNTNTRFQNLGDNRNNNP